VSNVLIFYPRLIFSCLQKLKQTQINLDKPKQTQINLNKLRYSLIRNKAVFVEKPMALNKEELRETKGHFQIGILLSISNPISIVN